MKQMKKALSIFLLAIFLIAGILSNVTVKATQVFRLVSPIINYVGVDHSPLVVGDTEKFTVTSKYEGMVQYRAFLFDGTKWNELTNGYSEAVDAKTPYVLPETKPFKLGKYKLSVWVKAAGETGISSNKNYDNYYVTNLNCTTKDDANRVYANGAAKIETKALTVKINGIENIGGIKGPYLYRLFIFNPTTGIWSNGAKEYTASPSYTFDEAGTYMVIVHANTAKSTTWKNYLAGKTKGAYEAWKTIVVTVKNEEIVKVIDTTVKAASFGAVVNVTLTNDGIKYFSTATKYQIYDGENELSAVTNLGTSTTVFPSKSIGDKVKVKLLDEGSKEIKDFNVLLGQSGTIIVTPPVTTSSLNPINGKEVEIKSSSAIQQY